MIKYLSPFKVQTLVSGDNQAYLVPLNTISHIRALTFHNTSENTVSIEVYVIPANVEVTEHAQRLVRKTLQQNESYLCPEVINHVLSEGMRVVLVGDGVNAMLSVAEQAA